MPLYKFVHYDNAEDARRAGAYAPRGAVKRLWQSGHLFERIVSGPAETGKTWGCCQYLNTLAWQFPGAQFVIARKLYADMPGSVLQTFERVIGPDSGVRTFGGEKPQWYDYPNGSRVWVAGLDRPGKALSSERDFVYVNQAEETTAEDWEVLTTRVTGRGATMPYTGIFGDCNPGPPNHWIKRRRTLKMFESRHEDNPTLFDVVAGRRGIEFKITPQGRRTMAVLDALTGVRKKRLRFGIWAQAEGTVYEEWDPAVHVIDEMPRGWRSWRKIRSIDFGYHNPFVCQWYAIDGDGRMYLYREIYHTRRLVQDHVLGPLVDPNNPKAGRRTELGINALSAGETYEATVADHDAEGRATLARYGVHTIPAYKNVADGIDAVRDRFRKSGDGKPRLFILRGCTVERDDDLEAAKLPVKTEEEPESYVYPKRGGTRTKNEQNPKDEPVKKDDHGMDAMRYAVAYEDLMNAATPVITDDVEVIR